MGKDDNTFLSRDPVVRREAGTWMRIVDVDGLGMRRAIAFEHEVTWLRGSTATVVMLNGADGVIREGGSRCDVSFLLQSVGSAIEAAELMAERDGLGTGPFGAVVRLTVEDRPALPGHRMSWDTAHTPPRWREVPRDWCFGCPPEAIDAWRAGGGMDRGEEPPHRYLKPREILKDAVIWDSRVPAAGRAALLDPAIAAALDGLPEAEVARIRAFLAEDLAEPQAA